MNQSLFAFSRSFIGKITLISYMSKKKIAIKVKVEYEARNRPSPVAR
jgi:hypothetical protein